MFEENGTLLAAESLLGASPKGEDGNGGSGGTTTADSAGSTASVENVNQGALDDTANLDIPINEILEKNNVNSNDRKTTLRFSRLADALNARDWSAYNTIHTDLRGGGASGGGTKNLDVSNVDSAERRAQLSAEQASASKTMSDQQLINNMRQLKLSHMDKQFTNEEALRYAKEITNLLNSTKDETTKMYMASLVGAEQISNLQHELAKAADDALRAGMSGDVDAQREYFGRYKELADFQSALTFNNALSTYGTLAQIGKTNLGAILHP